MARMLLSHNFDIDTEEIPILNRDLFAKVFVDGLKPHNNISCSSIDNPHWIVEILYSEAKYTPKEIGEICSQILVKKRQEQIADNKIMYDVLFLGGKKLTPTLSNSETSLKTGEWGVDVVETPAAEAFLTDIQWYSTTANKPAENIFKILYSDR